MRNSIWGACARGFAKRKKEKEMKERTKKMRYRLWRVAHAKGPKLFERIGLTRFARDIRLWHFARVILPSFLPWRPLIMHGHIDPVAADVLRIMPSRYTFIIYNTTSFLPLVLCLLIRWGAFFNLSSSKLYQLPAKVWQTFSISSFFQMRNFSYKILIRKKKVEKKTSNTIFGSSWDQYVSLAVALKNSSVILSRHQSVPNQRCSDEHLSDVVTVVFLFLH